MYFNLLSKNDGTKEINERLYEFKLLESAETYFKDKDGQDLTFYGFKAVEREDAADAWDETTTLYTSIWKGHKPFEADDREIISVGILRIILSDFIQQMNVNEIIYAIQKLPLGYQTIFNLFAMPGKYQTGSSAILVTAISPFSVMIFPSGFNLPFAIAS